MMENILEAAKLLMLGALIWMIWEVIKMVRKMGDLK